MADKESLLASFIDVPLWDRAQWSGTAFGHPRGGDETPFMGLLFKDGDAGAAIFTGLRKRLGGNADQHELLRVSIIEGHNPSTRPGYDIHIGTEIQNVLARAKADGHAVDPTRIVMVSRLQHMDNPQSPYLAAFKQKLKQLPGALRRRRRRAEGAHGRRD